MKTSPKINKFLLVLVLISGLLILNCEEPEQHSISVKNTFCEFAENPVGVDVSQPRLSWILSSPHRGQLQQAYRILAAGHRADLEQNIGDLWDSGKVQSMQSAHIRYAGKPLASNQKVFWKVRVWSSTGDSSAFSAAAAFQTALLSPDDWQAKWISRGAAEDPPVNKGYFDNRKERLTTGDSVKTDAYASLFRREFPLTKSVKRARVFVTGLGFYELFVNGKKVGRQVLSPAKTNYRHHVLYDVFEITSLLKQPQTAIGMMVGNGWFNPLKKWWSWRMQWFGRKRAILQLHLEYADGTSQLFCSDETWKTTSGPILSSSIYDGEIYDATQERTGWTMPNYDDSAWAPVHIAPAPGGKMVSQIMPPIRVTEQIKPVKIFHPAKDVYVYDLGQNFAGWVRLKVQGPRGTRVKLRFAENIEPDGKLDIMSNNLAKPTDIYILKGDGEEIYEPRFTYHGFRYVEITGFPGVPTKANITGQVVHSDCEVTGTFTCSNQQINRLHQCINWSQRSNMIGYPMDCPQRDERLGWLGDAHVTAEEAMHNFDMPLFYENWLRGIRENQNAAGDIPYISPRPFSDNFGTPAWSSAYHLIIWYHYLYYGDRQILAEHFSGMKRYVDYLSSTATNYILPPDKYDDWLSVSIDGWWKPGIHLSVATGYYYFNTKIVAQAARILGKINLAEKYEQLCAQIKKAYHKQFFNPQEKNYEIGSQFANLFPLKLGIVPAKHENAVLQNLIDDILIKRQGHLNTGILGTKYLMEVLSQYDRGDLACLIVEQPDFPGWTDLLRNRTTLSEHWEQSGSNNHVMFGSVDTWLYRELGGIQVDESGPGFQRIIIKPNIAPGLISVKTELKTIKGLVRSEWSHQNGVLAQEIQIPVNTTATVFILAKNLDNVTESGKSIEQAAGVRFLHLQGKHAVFEAGSGEYKFKSREVADLVAKSYVATPKILPIDTFISLPETAWVSLSCATVGAKIHFTLDGSEPSENSLRYHDPFPLTKSTLIQAKAFQTGLHAGFSREAHFTFVDPVYNGVEFQLFRGVWEKLPEFRTLTPEKTGHIYQFELKNINPPKFNFALQFKAFLEISPDGEYTFYTGSNDGSQLFINQKLIVDNDQEHGMQEKSGKIFLAAGRHAIKVIYFQSGGSTALRVSYAGPGVEKQVIPASLLFKP